jgi:hypothetical protein
MYPPPAQGPHRPASSDHNPTNAGEPAWLRAVEGDRLGARQARTARRAPLSPLGERDFIPTISLVSFWGGFLQALGLAGGILVERFHRAMEGSKVSIVRDPSFRPSLGPNNTTFRMVDLLLFEWKETLLNPLGP